MTITIIGHGYVGLVSACCFADFGNDVYVIGHTDEKLKRLRNGDPIIYEPGLKELLEKNNKAGRLHFIKEYEKAVSQSDIVFITVGAPRQRKRRCRSFNRLSRGRTHCAPSPKDFTVASCKSTVPVGTNKKN